MPTKGEAATESLSPGQAVGPYRLLERLGQGGMATTWLAEEAETGQRVVLKFPDVSQLGDPAVYERFRREMEIGRLVDHPTVPRCTALREDWRHPYLVMEFVSGRLLSDVLREEGPLPAERATALCRQLLEALSHLHSRGIVHRDLKPENLMVTPEGELRIIDFGLALLEGRPRVTWRGFSGLAGTPGYMAPEQIRGERGGPPADVYAAGAILYEMLAGRPPFVADNPLAVMYQALNDPLPPLPRRADLPPGLQHVVQRALHRDRSARYAGADAFLQDLQHWERVPPPPPDVPRRPRWRWLPGSGGTWNGLVVSVLAAALCAAVALLAVMWFHARG